MLWSVLKSSMRIHMNGTRVFQRCSILKIPANQIMPPCDSNTLPGRLFISQTTPSRARFCKPNGMRVGVYSAAKHDTAFVRMRQAVALFSRKRYAFSLDIKFKSGLRRALVTGERNRQLFLPSRVRSRACSSLKIKVAISE